MSGYSGWERGILGFSSEPNGGLIAAVSSTGSVHRKLIIALAAKHSLPTVFPYRYYAVDGGLISYGPDESISTSSGLCGSHSKGREAGRPAGAGADQVRDGDHLKTAKALGLTVPPSVLARADEGIE